MTKPTDIRVVAAEATTELIRFRAPLKFGGRVVTEATLLNVQVDVETREGRSARGIGSMPVGNVWAWPDPAISTEQTQAAMIEFGHQLARRATGHASHGHPLELTHEFAAEYAAIGDLSNRAVGISGPMPKLARLVAASPLEAAIHDGYGRVHGRNSYNLLGPEFVNTDISPYLTDEFRGEYLDRYTLRAPKPTMPLYHLVGALDPLDESDLASPIGDGLPETLRQWVLREGLTHLKIKLNGDDLAWDVQRVVDVERVLCDAKTGRDARPWWYSLDFNEKCANVQYVLDFLAGVSERSPAAMPRVQYIEQPTHRDLRANPENRMHAAAKIKPVVIDESLVDFESLQLAREQGYSGVALKACKGHSEALLMGAAAQKYNLFLCVQDLTCVGRSMLHSASLAARIPTIAAIESNGRQFCPAGNAPWTGRFPGMFQITDGTVHTGELDGIGLGF